MNLAGGNDLFNTIVPTNNVGAPQRTLYQQMRPDLAIPLSSLSGMGVGADPAVGSLALGALAARSAAPLQEASGDASRLYLIESTHGRDALLALHAAFFG